MLLASVLLVVGHFQERAHRFQMAEKGVRAEYDYIAPAQIWLMAIDSPPGLIVLPFVALKTKLRFVPQLAFVLAVGFFWFWIGSLIDHRLGRAPTPAFAGTGGGPWLVGLVALVGCLTLFGIGVHGLFTGAWPVLIDVSNVLWGLVLGFYFASGLGRRREA
jgi:hypothetical protein